ncbi:MAG TPA: hypothetical protein VGW80_10760 [Solirubrobacterales bacterium]|jgi:hypothetical protein|nr:hypothetical protein [Solirubrobacterales bacterium]
MNRPFPVLRIQVAKARWASADARNATQSIKGILFSAVVGAVAGFLASKTEDPSLPLVLGSAVGGVLAPAIVVFIWSFCTIPRRHLEWRIEELEENQDSLQSQLTNLLQEKHGDPLKFLPIYQELRADIREALRIINHAQDTNRLWGRTDSPEYRNWKKHKEEIASNPWARIDGIHGELLEAFDHIERLSNSTAMRFGGGRRVRDSDDLDIAVKALSTAEQRLNFSINRLEQLQTPPELWQGDPTRPGSRES